MVSVGKSLKKLKHKLSKGHSNPATPTSTSTANSPRSSQPVTPTVATPTASGITTPSVSLPRNASQGAASIAPAPSNGGIKGTISSKIVAGIHSATTEPVDAYKSPTPAMAATTNTSPASPARITITLKHIAIAWVSMCGLVFLAFLAWERPPWWEYVLSMVLTLPVGVAYAYLYHRNQVRKQESSYLVCGELWDIHACKYLVCFHHMVCFHAQNHTHTVSHTSHNHTHHVSCAPPTQLRVNPGIKGLNYLLGSVPTWISFKEKEKADVCVRCGGWCFPNGVFVYMVLHDLM